MKLKFTSFPKIFIFFAIILLNINGIIAQCIAPDMVWQNPVLISGTGGQINATYKFPSVTEGVDAYVKILDIVGGASLSSIDDNLFGYNAAWQPVIKTPQTQGVSDSYVSFKIEFKDSADSKIREFECFQLSFIDVDGDNQHVREYVAAKGADTFVVSNATILTLTNISPNFYQATGTYLNYAGIDTASYVTNINFLYKKVNKIDEVRFGNLTDAIFTVQNRYSCGYFKPVSMHNYYVLPVKYSSFDASINNNNNVILNWKIEAEANKNIFEVERSVDGVNFKTIGTVSEAENIIETNKSYSFIDKSTDLKSISMLYYRLKQVDKNGSGLYSKTLVVKMQNKVTVQMQVFPNPFTEKISVRFDATEKGNAEIRIVNITGQSVLIKQSTLTEGYNSIQIEGLNKLASGIYMALAIINGIIVNNQKIIKN